MNTYQYFQYFSISFIIGMFATLTVYHLLVFIGRTNDKSNLAYSLLSFANLFYTSTTRLLPYFDLNNTLMLILKVIAIIFTGGGFGYFAHMVLDIKKMKYYTISHYSLLIITGITSIIFILLNNNKFLIVYFITAGSFPVVFFIYMFIIIIKTQQYKERKKILIIFGYCLMLIMVTIILAVYSIKGASVTTPFLISISPFVLMMFVFAFALTDSFNREHKRLVQLETKLQAEVSGKTQELTLANNQLKSLDTLKNDFIANITHGFRSPLTIIMNLSDIALKYEKRLSGKVKYSVEQIYNSAVKMKTFVDKLLDVAKMDAKGIKLSVKMVGLVSFIKRLSEFYSTSVMLSRIKITTKLPDNEIKNFIRIKEN
ncbi:MAG: hypothetical protein KAT05_13045 [Spirochaetes bacterium]|nr:hypothetical protein [Spirochaetota bacterium]